MQTMLACRKNLNSETFDEKAKKEFLKGAQIAYETIVTNFLKENLRILNLY